MREPAVVSRGARTRSVWTNVALAVVIGVLVTTGLAIGARQVHDNNERRLLGQRVREVGAVLSAAIPTFESSLSSAATVAVATHGDPAAFEQAAAPIIARKTSFDSLGLWRLDSAGPRRVAHFGATSELASGSPPRLAELFARAARTSSFAVVDMLSDERRRLGYAFALPKPAAQYVVYGERTLDRTRPARVARDSAFADIDYALFVGRQPVPRKLIASSTGGGQLTGQVGSTTEPFGDTHLLLAISPRKELGGALLAWLPWILAGFGLLCTTAAASTVWRLSKRRHEAEMFALDNERLYADQRSVAQTLQHSLLPQTLPEATGLEFGAVYAPGTEGIDIGGDWYDVVPRDDGTVVVVVGDVSGHGLEAAAMMASLRFAIRAYAADGEGPAAILDKLTNLVNVGRDGHFATVLCGVIDLTARRATWAAAGHPRPLLVADGGGRFVPVPVGPPVGVVVGAAYRESQEDLPSGGTLLLYTDGLVERRGESIDVGFDRLADAASRVGAEPLADALFAVVQRAIPDGCDDDAALLGIRWTDREHSSGASRPGATAFPGTPAAVTEARLHVAAALIGEPEDVLETVALLVSELATNSVRHASVGFTIAVERTPTHIRVGVTDEGPGHPEKRSPDPIEPSGRGLMIVEALSDDWGTAPTPGGKGKTVWFQIARATASA